MDAVPFTSEKPKIVDITTSRKLADKVSESYVSCPEKERDVYLYCILASHPGRTLVFVNAISAVRRLAAVLKVLGLPVKALHAGMQQRARLKALDKFKSDPKAILVATDVAARGLDIKDVACVIHYQIPASADTYVHRSGRTARAEADGISIAFVTPKEHVRFRALLHSFGSEDIPEFPIDASLMKECRERVALAVKYDSIARKESKKKAEKSWLETNAEQMDILLSDDSDNEEIQGRKLGLKKSKTIGSAKSVHQERKDAEAIKNQLDRLLAEPLQPKFSRKYFTGGAASGVSFQNRGEVENNIVQTVKSVTGLAAEKNQAKKRVSVKKSAKPKNRAEALAAAVQKHIDRKRQKNGGGRKLVVAHAFGRNTSGATALQALQNT
jgi:ATP-dependent RNA helicase DDX24/MAK5